MVYPAFLFPLVLLAQEPEVQHPGKPAETRLPNGRLQRDALMEADHQKNLEDARELIRLTEALKADLDKQGQFVLSLGVIKKTEDIEKLARRIRARMKR